jgi:acyl carrier protein
VQIIPGPRLQLLVQYRTEVFTAAAIEALIERFQAVLAAMSADPSGAVRTLLDEDATTPTVSALRDTMVSALRATPSDHGPNPTNGQHRTHDHLEDILTTIYTQTLGIEHIGADDSFFDHGGDSLTAITLMSTINTTLHRNLPLATIINAPTINTLTQHL